RRCWICSRKRSITSLHILGWGRAIVHICRVTDPAATGAENRTAEGLTAVRQADDDTRVERDGAPDGLDFTWAHNSASANTHTNRNGRPACTGRPPKPMPSRHLVGTKRARAPSPGGYLMYTPSTRILSALAYDRGEEYDPAEPVEKKHPPSGGRRAACERRTRRAAWAG